MEGLAVRERHDQNMHPAVAAKMTKVIQMRKYILFRFVIDAITNN